MSVSGISGGDSSSIWQQFKQLQASGGATKDDLSQFQNTLQSADPTAAQRVGNLVSNFDAIDLNHDGKLDGSEMKAFGAKTGKAGGHGHHQHGGGSGGITEDQLSALDGKVKSAGKDDSLLSQLLASFNNVDTNKDGKIDGSEFGAFASANGFGAPQTSTTPTPAAATAPVNLANPSLSSITGSSLTSTISQLLKAYTNSISDDTQSMALKGITA